MFPYKDDNPTLTTPVVTVALIAINLGVWVLVQGMGAEPELSRSVCTLGLIPGELLSKLPVGEPIQSGPGVECLVGPPLWYTPVTSMFMHGGWLHVLGNMWFLWVFGNNVEDSMGPVRFVVFYLVAGLAAALMQIVLNPASPIPMVGASGAISGVMGAYIVLYPKVRVHMLIFLGFFITTITVPAYLMLGYWILLQLLGVLPVFARESGGIAFGAHVGGFLAGALLITFFKSSEMMARRLRVIGF